MDACTSAPAVAEFSTAIRSEQGCANLCHGPCEPRHGEGLALLEEFCDFDLWHTPCSQEGMQKRSCSCLTVFVVIYAIAGCGGSTESTGVSVNNESDSGGQPGEPKPGSDATVIQPEASGPTSHCDGATSSLVSRPQAIACAATNFIGGADGGPIACTVDADCQEAGIGLYCRKGACSPDACLVDGDCPTGEACGCSNMFRGNIAQANRCVMSSCRVDADCGPGGVCSPSFSARCGGLAGFYCHSAADSCQTDTDCCGSTPQCRYQPTLGHWACQAIVVCNG